MQETLLCEGGKPWSLVTHQYIDQPIDTTTLHQALPAANFRKTLELEDLQLGNKRVTSNAQIAHRYRKNMEIATEPRERDSTEGLEMEHVRTCVSLEIEIQASHHHI